MDGDGHHLVRQLGAPFAIEAQDGRRLLHRPEDRPGEDDRADVVQAEFELGDDAEIAAAAAQAPEQVGVLGLARLHELAVGRHQVDRQEVVDRHAVLALEPSDAAAEREAGDARVGDDAAGGREPEGLRLAIELTPENARLYSRRARLRVGSDPSHLAQIDHQPAVAGRQAGEAVAAAADGDRKVGPLREPHRGDHVGDAAAAGDQRRPAIDRAVPDLAVLVVARVLRRDELAAERCFQLAQRGLVELDLGGESVHVTDLLAKPKPLYRPTISHLPPDREWTFGGGRGAGGRRRLDSWRCPTRRPSARRARP